MPLQHYMKLVSVDDHLVEHPRVWLDRLPQADHEQGPRLIEIRPSARYISAIRSRVRSSTNISTDTCIEVWTYQGAIYPGAGLNAVAGKDPREWGWGPVRFDQMMPGCHNPTERLKDMDLDGVHTGMAFPSFPRFAGTLFLEGGDRDLALRCVQAYNDFNIDEWSAADPGRLPPIVIMPLWDVDLCIAELRRTLAKGAKAVSFIESLTPLGLPSFHTNYWDPLFSLAEEADIPFMMHFGTSGTSPLTAPDAPEVTSFALMGLNSMQAMINLCFSPVFHQHPKLKIVLAEGGIGWMPWMLEKADTTWERQRFLQNINQEVKPSELFRRNIWGCFITDRTGIGLRHEIGLDRILWECDFPHSDSMWPNSRKVLAEAVRDVPDHEVHMIAELTARELFHLKPA